MTDEYKINMGIVNWQKYIPNSTVLECRDMYLILLFQDKYHFFCKTKEDGDYLKMRSPEWFIL